MVIKGGHYEDCALQRKLLTVQLCRWQGTGFICTVSPAEGSRCLRVCENGGGSGSQPGFQGEIFSSFYLYLYRHGLCSK